MEGGNLERLAAKLRRPAHALSALARLGAGDLAALERIIDEACARQGGDTERALRKAFPQPLRSLILGKSRRRA